MRPLKVAMVSEHASPLAALGGVDAGGQNVYVAALSASRRRAACRTYMQIKPMSAVRTARLLVINIRGENPRTFRADNADFWLAVGIGIANKNVGREQIHARGASRTRKCLDPKKVERVANVSLGIRSLVERSDAFTDPG